jgi:hypothetical protein
MSRAVRDTAGWGTLGSRRYQRYVAAFDWSERCVERGYYLEAIAILDSLICDRLASRLGHLTGEGVELRLTCGQLCQRLIGGDSTTRSGSEKDAEFREAIGSIREWVGRRNDALHAAAKVLHSDDSSRSFPTLLKSRRRDALDGKKVLRKFDDLDTASRARVGKSPATRPNAFFPERRSTGLRS